MNPKISFLILHYQAEKDTEECVNSIINNIEYDNYNIVIVDNGSPNQFGRKIQEKYKNNENIKVLINNENLGFAKGNNVGFQYIKKYYDSDFIVMINNDTIIEDKDFLKRIIEEYIDKRYDILGPKIISLVDGKNQNPVYEILDEKKKIRKVMIKFIILLTLNYLNLESFIRKLKLKNENRFNKMSNNSNDKYMLHGSCLIFSKDYINKYEGLYDKTFLYGEEDILYYIAKRDNLNMRYSDKITIYHKEDSSINSIFDKEKNKRRFLYKQKLNSLKILYNLLKE